MKIREAIIEDINIMLQWRNSKDFNFCGILTDDNLTIDDYLDELIINQYEYIIIGIVNKKKIGMLWLDSYSNKNKRKMISLFIDEKYRNNLKLIVFLINGIENIAEKFVNYELYCEISPFNKKMQNLAKKLEFKLVDKIEINNTPLDVMKINLFKVSKFKKKYYKLF